MAFRKRSVEVLFYKLMAMTYSAVLEPPNLKHGLNRMQSGKMNLHKDSFVFSSVI